ncbi:MAG TPA: hypothetical protein VFS00_04175, partial [Polyangiaceae bacterium]|nr:hypothetical protein [Polyangiaceae bacterium]
PTESATLTSPYRQEPFTPSPRRLARLREGALALVLVARTVWHDVALRRFYLRVGAAQAIVTLVLGVFAALVIFEDDDDRPGARHARLQRRAKSAVVTEEPDEQGIVIKGDQGTIVINPRGVDIRPNGSAPAGDESAPAPASASPRPGRHVEVRSGRDGKGPRVSVHVTTDDDDDHDEDDGATAARHDRPHGGDADADADQATGGRPGAAARLMAFWGKLVTLYGALVAIGWGVVALSRDYHDVISREASLRLNLPPEDPPLVPRVRLNVDWIKTRLQRRFRGFMLFTLGVPPLWALSFFVVLPLMGINRVWAVFDSDSVVSRLYGLLAAGWGAYWLIVFTGAKTALAWADEH